MTYYKATQKNPADILIEAVQNKNVAIFSKYYSNFPDKWDYFINFIDHGSSQPVLKERESESEKAYEEMRGVFRKGLIAFWGYMTIMADRPSIDFFPGLEEIKLALLSIFKKDPDGSMALISLSRIEKKLERHEDPTDNIYIQCVGHVTWRIYAENSQEYTDHILGPGDLMFIPEGTSHEVFPNSARCAIVFTYKNNV